METTMTNTNTKITLSLALLVLTLACDTAEPTDSLRAGDTTTDETTDTDATDDPPHIEAWCCWCVGPDLHCLPSEGPDQCELYGCIEGLDSREVWCTGVPILGTIECADLVCG
jgi:hypothetical protein